MAKANRKNLSFFTWAFLILAFVFLALGLGTLGNVNGVGKSYELLAAQDKQVFGVVFELKNPEKKLKDGTTETVYLRLHEVYVNMGAIYTEAGSQAVTLRLNRSTSGRGTQAEKLTFNTGSSYQYDTRLNNLLPESLTEEELEKQKLSAAIDSDLGNWITPFSEKIQNGKYDVDRYYYYRISAPEKGVLVNEVVFVGEVLTGSGGEGTGEYRVVPTSVYYATPLTDESREAAIDRAHALIDCQNLPSSSQSSFFRYGKEEVAMAMTVAQMSLGNTFGADNVYYGDTVYNSLGTSLVAFGTVIFGNSPFGLRFFPMLASFGVLVIGFFFAKKLFGSDKAGFAFALLYALCNFSFGLGHLGTPLMIGVFFLVASLYCCYLYYANGIGNAGIKDCLPLALSGLCGAAAICVNGAMLIPVLGVVALFALGLVKQLQERRAVLDAAIEEAEAEETAETAEQSVSVAAEAAQTDEPTGKAKVAKVLSDYRRKDAVAPAAFFTTLVIGALLFSLLFLLPVYYVAVKLYDTPAALAANVFYL
ncbi:MAG: glycosyltransferase family 39 protein, partial [Clostridia bacterium]|nr:glycosyltransferase family 39 protein [Clostridia bacterium]